MSPEEKRAYLSAIGRRYKRADRKKKSKILDEFCAVCHYHRKYAIRLLHKQPKKRPGKPGRKSKYASDQLLDILKRIWLATDQMCSKRLKAALPEWLPYYDQEYGQMDDESRERLYELSAATIDRLLRPIRVRHKRKGLSGTKPGRLLKNQIPIKTDHWDVSSPGYLEADTVAHCGDSLSGNFIWSITLTDIYSTWTESRATWNKGAAGVLEQIKNIEKSLPFEIFGFDCDNGSEFLNHHLVRYFLNRDQAIQFTRSRPYRKNDNAHIEQKNWTHVRHLFGYDRFEKPRLVLLMNNLYQNEWSLYQNHFCPTMKLIEKKKINSRYYKRYDKPKTPYQRLLESKAVGAEKKRQLKSQHQTLNPFLLKREIERQLKNIFKWVKISSSVRNRL